MNPTVQFSPKEYVDKLHSLTIPGYTGATDGKVAVSRYTSANVAFGGNQKVAVLYQTMAGIMKKSNDSLPAFSRLLTGQGMMSEFIDFLTLVNKYGDEVKKKLPQYFSKDGSPSNFLQAMLDDSCPGMDCIGFVGTYLAEAGAFSGYQSIKPIDYSNYFKPVTDLSQITAPAVVMLTNGMHIQIIDKITEQTEGSGFITVDLCQSSSLKDHPESMGPQCNKGVRISGGGGKYLPVQEFRDEVKKRTTQAEYEADEEKRKAQPNYKPRQKPSFDAAVEAELRASMMTQVDSSFAGYKGGHVFQLSGGGTPANPVSGSVYVGVSKGFSVRTPSPP